MDFARPLACEECIVTRSKIRHIPVPETTSNDKNEDEKLDYLVIQAANQAAVDLFLGPPDGDDDDIINNINNKASIRSMTQEQLEQSVDASLYREQLTPVHTTIQPGDLVVIMESFDKLDFVYIKQGSIFYNRNGHFHHDDCIGLPFGCKIRSRNHSGYGFCYLLKPTPELWARSLNHRTQIVHELDQAQIIFQLQLRPNMCVAESGTGSGAMSHALLRTIAPYGCLHTYEFNQMRVETARTEFEKNGVSHLVTVHHRDVTTGGFDLPAQSVDAVFLDLPEPWSAIPHAAVVLKTNSRIATYSPCVEQTQKTVDALNEAGFHSIRTMEYRLQEHYVDQVEYEPPPCEKRQRTEPHVEPRRGGQVNDKIEQEENEGDNNETGNNAQSDAVASEEGNGATCSEGDMTPMKATDADSTDSAVLASSGTADVIDNNPVAASTSMNSKRKKMVVARPFVMMRGHTAFLTFATSGNKPRAQQLAQQQQTDE